VNKIAAIVLVSLLGFLGCSDGNDGTSTFSGEAIPLAPFAQIHTYTPTYTWTSVPGATRYLLKVEDGTRGIVIEEWYTPEDGECASEERMCSVTPEISVWGDTWKVQACAGEVCGLWSDDLEFWIKFGIGLPPELRFHDNGDGTVTDYYKQTMWTRCASLTVTPCKEAVKYCEDGSWGCYTDWQLPEIHILQSLVDTQNSPALPTGHPFTDVGQGFTMTWSRTPLPPGPRTPRFYRYGVYFQDGRVGARNEGTPIHVVSWCVRNHPISEWEKPSPCSGAEQKNEVSQ